MTEAINSSIDVVPAPSSTSVREATAANWWKIGDWAVLLAYVCVTTFTLQHHEKWADEAQAWLLARDLDLKTLWFHELRYEGHPGLWHTILWVAQRVFHMPYAGIGYIGLAFSIAGVAVLIFKAPFPWYIRWPLAFTYVLVYQYAVIARPYTLLPLLCFSAAIFFRDKEHPERLTITLVLLASLTFHGTIIAACISMAYIVESYKLWPTFDERLRKRHIACLIALGFAYFLLFLVLKPPPDLGEFAAKQTLKKAQPSFLTKIETVTSGAFLDWIAPSTVFVVGALMWCISRKRYLTFLLPVCILIAFYGAVHGYAHHHGIVFVAALTGLWIAWPSGEDEARFNSRETNYLKFMVALILILCAVNIWDAVIVIDHEYRYPYSGAEEAANYLKAVNATQEPIFGYFFGMNAVQAYFDHNILANKPDTYVHLSAAAVNEDLNLPEIERVKPGYVVVSAGVRQEDLQALFDVVQQPLASDGYALVHVADGYNFTKRAVYERAVYFIFKRTIP